MGEYGKKLQKIYVKRVEKKRETKEKPALGSQASVPDAKAASKSAEKSELSQEAIKPLLQRLAVSDKDIKDLKS